MSTFTYIVKVASSKFTIDGGPAPKLTFRDGDTFVFDQADASNSGHTLQFSATSNNSGSSEYTTGVTKTGTAGQAGAKTTIVTSGSTTDTLYYYSSGGGTHGEEFSNSGFNTTAENLLKPIVGSDATAEKWGPMINQSIDQIVPKSGGTFSGDLTVTGDMTVSGTTTTIDTILQSVDKLEVGANSSDYGAQINQAGTGNILQLQDSGTDVLVVADGGAVTTTSSLMFADGVPKVITTVRDGGDAELEMEISGGHGFSDNDRVRFTTTNTLPTGLAIDTDYYVIEGSNANEFAVSTVAGPAIDNTVDYTDTGTGTHSVQKVDMHVSDGTVTGTFAGSLTGNVTGNASGTAATVTGAAQSAITSVGTLTALTVTGAINGTEIVTTATDNLGVGIDAVDSITTGDYNVAFGDYALEECTEGVQNTAIGWSSGEETTTGSYNTSCGYKSLENVREADKNTAIGTSALANCTGDLNTAIGYQAGNLISTGSNNIYIGETVGYLSSATENYKLNIGDTIYADLSTGDIWTKTTGKIKQKGAFMQNSVHQSWVMGG